MNKIKLHDKTYNRIRILIYVVLPFIASWFYIVGQFVEIRRVDEVVGSCVLLITIFGILLHFSDRNSEFDGEMIVEKKNDGRTLASLALDTEPNELFEKERVIFKVLKKKGPPRLEDDPHF